MSPNASTKRTLKDKKGGNQWSDSSRNWYILDASLVNYSSHVNTWNIPMSIHEYPILFDNVLALVTIDLAIAEWKIFV
jgi:hypothetical protein